MSEPKVVEFHAGHGMHADPKTDKPTRLEPYPQLNQVQQDEAIALLLGVVKKLDQRVAVLEKK